MHLLFPFVGYILKHSYHTIMHSPKYKRTVNPSRINLKKYIFKPIYTISSAIAMNWRRNTFNTTFMYYRRYGSQISMAVTNFPQNNYVLVNTIASKRSFYINETSSFKIHFSVVDLRNKQFVVYIWEWINNDLNGKFSSFYEIFFLIIDMCYETSQYQKWWRRNREIGSWTYFLYLLVYVQNRCMYVFEIVIEVTIKIANIERNRFSFYFNHSKTMIYQKYRSIPMIIELLTIRFFFKYSDFTIILIKQNLQSSVNGSGSFSIQFVDC